jgi:hypothetical protein
VILELPFLLWADEVVVKASDQGGGGARWQAQVIGFGLYHGQEWEVRVDDNRNRFRNEARVVYGHANEVFKTPSCFGSEPSLQHQGM